MLHLLLETYEMAKNRKLNIKESEITVIRQNETDYICLTDMTTSFREGSGLIGKWITNKNTLDYLGVWERINNPDFNYPEFEVIEQTVCGNSFGNAKLLPNECILTNIYKYDGTKQTKHLADQKEYLNEHFVQN